jgi:essential nuclear protein 1
MFNKFIPSGDQDPIFNPRQPEDNEEGPGTNLADLILEKIAAYEAKQAGQNQPVIQGGGPPEDAVEIPAKAMEVFEKYELPLCGFGSSAR